MTENRGENEKAHPNISTNHRTHMHSYEADKNLLLDAKDCSAADLPTPRCGTQGPSTPSNQEDQQKLHAGAKDCSARAGSHLS